MKHQKNMSKEVTINESFTSCEGDGLGDFFVPAGTRGHLVERLGKDYAVFIDWLPRAVVLQREQFEKC